MQFTQSSILRFFRNLLPVLRDAELEHQFQKLYSRRTLLFIRWLGLLAMIGAFLIWLGSYSAMHSFPEARLWADLIKLLYILLCLLLIYLSFKEKHFTQLRLLLSLVFAFSGVIIAMRLSDTSLLDQGVFWQIFSVSRDALFGWICVSAAVLLFIPVNYLVNVIISFGGLLAFFGLLFVFKNQYPFQAVYVYSTVFLIVLTMSGHFQRLQRKHYKLVLELQNMNTKLKKLAATDSLTGILNRRSFLAHLQQEFRRSVRHDLNMALLMFDLDHFKQVNDSYGHAAGDLVLLAITRHVAGQIRQEDSFGRLGGEEFAILLPETDLEHANHMAERMCREIQALSIKLDQNSVSISASFGLTKRNMEDPDEDSILIRVDRALYQAKKDGRNRVRQVLE